MRRPFYTGLVILSILVLYTHTADAHAVNKHLEELYGNSYLPLFILAKLLPFVGLGFLSKKLSTSIPRKQMLLFLILGLVIGLGVSFLIEGFDSVFLINNISIILSGIFLLVIIKTESRLILGLFLFFGLTLGYEHGLYLSHAHNFVWLYLIILTLCIAVFTVLCLHTGTKVKLQKAGFQSLGVLLILFGITAVLLS